MKMLLVISTIFFSTLFLSFTPAPQNNKKAAEKSEGGIKFIEQDWKAAVQEAKANNKLIFLDIYATWCGPCKMLKKNTFTDKAVGEFFNKNFVNLSVDGEAGVGPQLAQLYQIQAYPTLIVVDATGKPVLYTVGYIDAKTLMDFGQTALKKRG